jgi:hypothetical protein
MSVRPADSNAQSMLDSVADELRSKHGVGSGALKATSFYSGDDNTKIQFKEEGSFCYQVVITQKSLMDKPTVTSCDVL